MDLQTRDGHSQEFSEAGREGAVQSWGCPKGGPAAPRPEQAGTWPMGFRGAGRVSGTVYLLVPNCEAATGPSHFQAPWSQDSTAGGQRGQDALTEPYCVLAPSTQPKTTASVPLEGHLPSTFLVLQILCHHLTTRSSIVTAKLGVSGSQAREKGVPRGLGLTTRHQPP